MKKLIDFLKLWPEMWSIPVAFLVWILHPTFLRWLDPTSAPFDSGVFSAVAFALVVVLLANGIAFLGIKHNFKSIFSFYKHDLKTTIQNLTPCQKLTFLLALYFGLAFMFVLAVFALL